MNMHSNRRAQYAGRTAAVGALVAILSVGGVLGCSSGRAKKSPETDAAVGEVVGTEPTRTVEGTQAEAVPGDTVGGIITHYMDRQAKELSRIEGASTKRVDDWIRVTWDGAMLFDYDSAMLKIGSHENIKKMADVLQKYVETDIIVAAYTDTTGVDEYNRKLSERRALSVRNFLIDVGLSASRLTIVGYGELRPFAPDDTIGGRCSSHCVDIEIRPDEALKARAAEADSTGQRTQP